MRRMNKNKINGRILHLFAPIMMLLIAVLTLGVVLIIHSNTYAVVTYSSETNTSTSFTSGQGYSVSLTMPKSVTFGIDGTNSRQTVRADARVIVTTNSVTGYKLYLTSESKNLTNPSNLYAVNYANTGSTSIQKSSLDEDNWGVFVKRNNVDYIIPICGSATLTEECLVSKSSTPVTNEKAPIEYGVNINAATATPGHYNSERLVYTAIVNSSTTGEFPITVLENSKVPLLANGNQLTSSIKHRFKITIPILENNSEVLGEGIEERYKVTIGNRFNCKIINNGIEYSADGFTFDCVADFSTANPRFLPGQKADLVVDTIPYGYTYIKQNAIEFVAGEKTFNYTGTPQEMVSEITGKYMIEAMGANGGDQTQAQAGEHWYGSNEVLAPGIGGYTSGLRNMFENQKFMVFVGGKGASASDRGPQGGDAKGGFNGGGNGAAGLLIPGTNTYSFGGAGGGGSSDVRPDVQDYVNFHNLRYRNGRDQSDILLNDGPWANLSYGTYQAVIKTVNLPDSDFEGALVYYDYGYHYLSDVYIQKFGDYILVYFNYPVGSPAATHLPGGDPGPGVEIRLKVKTTNQVADITSVKFYPTNERILVAGGGAGGSYIAKGGNGGGLTGTKPFYLGSTTDPNYSGFRFPNGGNQGAGGGAGFGASAPSHGAIYPNTSIETAGRAGAGGGWFGGYAEQSDYNTSTVIGAGAGGGSGHFHFMVTNGTTYGYGEAGKDMSPWSTLQPADKNGIVRFKLVSYAGMEV